MPKLKPSNSILFLSGKDLIPSLYKSESISGWIICPKTNISPENRPGPKKETRKYSNFLHFQVGVLAVSFRVDYVFCSRIHGTGIFTYPIGSMYGVFTHIR